MEEMKNIPEIRFDGFKEDWETDSFENLTKINQGLQISITNRFKKRIPQSHFYITNEFLKEGAKSEYYILNPPESVLCTNDDVLMTRTGNTGEVVTGVNGAFHNNFFKIKFDREKIDKDYLVYFLKNEATQSLILRLAGVSTIPDLNHNDFYQIEMPFPVDIKEQNKISQLLGNLDSLLNNHQTQLKKLTNLKKAMLIKMFPQDGASVPEIRFKGFDGEWESHKINSIAELNPKATLPERFNYVDLESVSGTQIIGSKNILKEYAPSRAQRLAKKGDLFYQTVRPYQKNNCLFDKAEKDFVFSTGYAQLRPSVNNHFLFAILQREAFVHEVMIRCTGTSYPAISSSDLGDIEIMVSNDISEQFKIGKYFKYLDFLIENNNEQLKKLNQIKKACLSKLFVTQD